MEHHYNQHDISKFWALLQTKKQAPMTFYNENDTYDPEITTQVCRAKKWYKHLYSFPDEWKKLDFKEIDAYYVPPSTAAACTPDFAPDAEFYIHEFEAVIRTKRFSVAGLDGIQLRFLIPLIRA